MSFKFPDSPTEGLVAEIAPGRRVIFTGGRWRTHSVVVDAFAMTALQNAINAANASLQAIQTDLPGDLNGASQAAVDTVRGGVSAEGDTLAKLLSMITGIENLLTSDNVTLDTFQEIVDFIEVNRSSLDALGLSKINVADIVDVLTDTSTDKPLSAAQGKALKDAIDALAISVRTGADNILKQYMLQDMGWKVNALGDTGVIDFTAGNVQTWAPTGTKTLSITNWPAAGNLGELLIKGTNLGAATITWPTINWIKSDGSMVTSFASLGVTLRASGEDFIMLWTLDGGTTIYGKVVR